MPTNADVVISKASASSIEADANPVDNVAFAATIVTNLSPQIDLSVSAAAVAGAVGSNAVFTVTVSNLGPSTATGVVISNRIPANASFVSATDGSVPVSGLLLVNLGTINAGASGSAQIVVKPDLGLPLHSVGQPTGQLPDTFRVFANEPDAVPANNSVTAIATIVAPIPGTPIVWTGNPGGSVITTAGLVFGVGPVMEGNSGHNADTVQAGDLVLLNDPNAGTDPTNWLAVARFFNPNDPTGTNHLDATESQAIFPLDLGSNGFAGFQLLTVASFVPAGPVNTTNGVTTIVATYNEFGPAGAILAAQSDINVLTVISPFTDVSLSATASPEPVTAGNDLVYAITVSNAVSLYAPDMVTATGVVLSNQMPSGFTFVSATGGVVPSNGVLLVPIGSVPEGTSAVVQIVVKPASAGSVSNRFAVFASQTDPNTTNNSVTVISTVLPAAPLPVDLSVRVVPVPDPATVGIPLTYTLTVTNQSADPATGVVVTNSLPAGVNLISLLPSQGSANTNGNNVIYTVGGLTNGQSVALAIVVVPGVAGQLTNDATVFSVEPDSQPANNTSHIVTTVLPAPPGTNLVLTVVSSLTLNRQTGLFEQHVQVSNFGVTVPSAVRVLVSGLKPNAQLINATGITNGIPFVQSGQPLPGGAHVDLTLEYFYPDRLPQTNLVVTVEAGVPLPPPSINGQTLDIDRPPIALPDGSILVEFTAIPGRIYAVQYGPDMSTWQTAVPVVTATANRVQWIDNGPPKTDSKPSQLGSRYYRVVLLQAN